MENKIEATDNFMVVPKKFLLGAYIILPILVSVVLIDIFYFDRLLQPNLGVDAIYLPIFLFIFLLPHIIASLFSFFDSEYVSYYKKHLFIFLPIFLLITLVVLYFDYRYGLLLFFLTDAWHGIRQKVGIGLILGMKPGLVHRLWTYVPFATTSLVYVYFVLPEVVPNIIHKYISEILFIGALSIIFVSVLQLLRSDKKVYSYIILFLLFFLTSYFFVLANYIFFAFLAFRFVHDLNAFAFYVAHDHNRNREGYKNYFYKLFSATHIPILVLAPLLGFLFAYIVRSSANGVAIGYAIIILLCMSHFYLEGVMWKRESPHRKQILVK